MKPLLEDFADNFSQDETSLQILMANIDFAFMWIVIGLFVCFNISYWTWNSSRR